MAADASSDSTTAEGDLWRLIKGREEHYTHTTPVLHLSPIHLSTRLRTQISLSVQSIQVPKNPTGCSPKQT